MLRLSINELTTYRWSFEMDVQRYADAGFRGIGVWRHKLSDYGEEKGAELLREYGLEVSNLLWAGGFTGSDGRRCQDAVRDGAEAIRLAGMLQSRCLIVYTGGRDGHTANHARRMVVDALRQLVPLAEEENVTLAIEPMHAAYAGGCTFLTSIDAALDVINEVGSPQIKLAFDTYHLCHDDGYGTRIPDLVDQIAVVHLADGILPLQKEQRRCLLGEGEFGVHEIVARFLAAGYDGYFDIKLFGEEIEICGYQQVLRHSRAALANLFATV